MRKCKTCKQVLPLEEFTLSHQSATPHQGARCKQGVKTYNRKLYLLQREHRLVYSVERRALNKHLAFEAYGGDTCVCCGVKGLAYLTIDHINNDGKEHRKKLGIKSGNHFYVWLRNNNYPSGFQVLCFNCNMAKFHNKGICPHQQAA